MFMDNNEMYSLWVPMPDVSGKVLVDELSDTESGLNIRLRFPSYSKLKGRRLSILFDPYVAYRNVDESYRTHTFNITRGFEQSLYLVKESNWLEK